MPCSRSIYINDLSGADPVAVYSRSLLYPKPWLCRLKQLIVIFTSNGWIGNYSKGLATFQQRKESLQSQRAGSSTQQPGMSTCWGLWPGMSPQVTSRSEVSPWRVVWKAWDKWSSTKNCKELITQNNSASKVTVHSSVASFSCVCMYTWYLWRPQAQWSSSVTEMTDGIPEVAHTWLICGFWGSELLTTAWQVLYPVDHLASSNLMAF